MKIGPHCRLAVCLCLILAPLAAHCQVVAVPEQINLEMQRRGEALVQRLREGQPTRVVIFGDSISDGWGTDGTHVFQRMFVDCLRYRFPGCRLEHIVVATPGQTTGEALGIARSRVIDRDPHLVVVQFGGNDKGFGRSLADFRRDFDELLAWLSEATNALVIACLPPIAEVMGENRWSSTARDVATRQGVPWADFHRAIGAGPHDFRSSFPFESHPGSFTHVIMAKALLGAFDHATGAEPPFTCTLSRGTTVSAEDTCGIRAEIVSTAAQTTTWEARIEFGRQCTVFTGSLPEGGRTIVEGRFRVPDDLPAGHAFSTPVHLFVRGDGYGSFDTGWLVMAPAVSALLPHSATTETAETAERPPEDNSEAATQSQWHEVGANALVLGRHLWRGEDDLSARFRVTRQSESLRFEIHVTDDDVTVADLTDPSRGDSVELYLDLRDGRHQGQPVYSSDVLALQVIPPADHGSQARWRSMHAVPRDLRDISVLAAQSQDGYRVRVELPLRAIEARRGANWGGLGFDLGINDADDGGTRKSQMMWSGTGENYIDPAFLAGVYPGTLPAGATRRALQ
ncbi:MAG: GDSL-type esterase/lipase family protein [Armatimonadota bacterium]